MAELVTAMAVVHNPMITGRWEAAALNDRRQVEAAFAELAADIRRAAPDWLLVVTNEHLRNAFYPYRAPFTVGVADRFRSYDEPHASLPSAVVPSSAEIGSGLVNFAYQSGVDVAVTSDLLLDHGTMVPLRFLTPELDRPVVHIHQMTAMAPRATLARCYDVGRMLRSFIEQRPAAERVAAVGTGGLSHWVGHARTGEVNSAWDQQLLHRLETGDHDSLTAMTDAAVDEGGNGAHEIRNWVTVAGLASGVKSRTVVYVEDTPEWTMGSALIRFEL